uniref:Uncharacterized protein n=1 Tax=Lepeophtheirus salmonis TaxID=72036 RepID=A0A0K2TJI7_LEPSM
MIGSPSSKYLVETEESPISGGIKRQGDSFSRSRCGFRIAISTTALRKPQINTRAHRDESPLRNLSISSGVGADLTLDNRMVFVLLSKLK